jgi:hypothetical protein
MKKNRRSCALLLTLVCSGAAAHDAGPAHHDPASGTASDRPHQTADGNWIVSKAVQRLLGLRTEVIADVPRAQVELLGEVVADPDRRGALRAPQAGRLESVNGSWPLPGRAVSAGEVLAVLRPTLTQRERAQRRATLVQIEQKLRLARINAGRLRVQAAGGGDMPATGNVYLEQAEAELAAQEQLQTLVRESIEGRVSLRVPVAGVLTQVNAQSGDQVSAGAPLFDIAEAGRARVVASSYEPDLLNRIESASTALPGMSLLARGQEPDPRGGWSLIFEARGDALPATGTLIRLQLHAFAPAAQTCAAGRDFVWVHLEAETFRRVDRCTSPPRAGTRVVTQGAALLDAYSERL